MDWIARRHNGKSQQWKYQRYFRSQGLRKWIFTTRLQEGQGKRSYLDLFRASQISIQRHVKIKGEATPFDPEYADYFRKRQRRQERMRVQEGE